MFDWFKRRKSPQPPLGGFPYPLTIVHGREVAATFERLKREGSGTPIVLGGEDALRRQEDLMKCAAKKGRTVASVLRHAAEHPFPQGLRAELAEEARKFKTSHPEFDEEEEDIDRMGAWPDTVAPPAPRLGPESAFDLKTRAPLERVFLALIPTKDATEIPAYLQWGDWNAVPAAYHHVAAARHWQGAYGAELVTMASDVVEYRVERRPRTRDEALALAREHYDYCGEIEELAPYAAELMVSDWWYFWWD